jgi:hypothetical protein
MVLGDSRRSPTAASGRFFRNSAGGKETSGRYPKEFRRMAVKRLKNCANILALSRELGVHRRLLYKWRNQLEPVDVPKESLPQNSREFILRKQDDDNPPPVSPLMFNSFQPPTEQRLPRQPKAVSAFFTPIRTRPPNWVGLGQTERQSFPSDARLPTLYQSSLTIPETASKWRSRLTRGRECWRHSATIQTSFEGMGVPAFLSSLRTPL